MEREPSVVGGAGPQVEVICTPPLSSTTAAPETLTRESSIVSVVCLTLGRGERLGPIPKPHISMTESLPIVSAEKEHTSGPCWVQPTVLSAGLDLDRVLLLVVGGPRVLPQLVL